MKRSAHLILALVAGLLLQGTLSAAASSVSALVECGGSSGSLGRTDEPALPESTNPLHAAKPFLSGTPPDPFLAVSYAPPAVTLERPTRSASPAPRVPASSRYVYLTTRRLRL